MAVVWKSVLTLLMIVGGAAVAAAPLRSVKVSANPQILLADGKSVTLLSAEVRDERGNLVPDGTQVQFATSLGTLQDTLVRTVAGVARTQLTSSTLPGVATITVTIPGASALGETQVTFTDDPNVLRRGVSTYLFSSPQYLAYSADWRCVEAISSEGKAEFVAGGMRVLARSYQYRLDEDLLVAEGAVMTRGKQTLRAERLRYSPRRDEGQAVLIEDEKVHEVLLRGPLWQKEPLTASRPDAYLYLDLSGSELLFTAESAVLLPGERIQFRHVKVYMAGERMLSLPMYDLNFRTGEALGQQIVGLNASGITLDLPLYYAVSPERVGALRLRHAQRVGRAVYAVRPGWSLDLEHTYNRPSQMEGAFVVSSLLTGDWGLRWSHTHWFNPALNGYFYADMPAHRSLYLSSGLAHTFSGGRLGLNLSGGRNLSGPRFNDLRADFYLESRSFRIGDDLRMTMSVTLNARDTRFAERRVRSEGMGLRSRLYLAPQRIAGFHVNASLMAGHSWGSGRAGGSNVMATLFATRPLGSSALLNLMYDYTDDQFVRTSGVGKHRLSGMFSWSAAQRLELSLSGSQMLDSGWLTLYADASYRLSSLWRVGANLSLSRFQQTRYNDLEISIGYRIGIRELLLTWSSLTRRWQVDLIAVGF